MSQSGATVHHSTGFYVWIWVALLFMIGVSIAVGYLGHPLLATVLIFAVATLKAYLVATFYMGLAWEPNYVAMVLIIATLFIVILFVALIPDIIYVYGKP